MKKTIIDDAKNFPVVILTGARQVGKSTLLHVLKEDGDILANEHINLKDLNLKEFANSDPIGFLNNYKFPIIIDEIQEAPGLFNQIKVVVDKQRLTNKEKSCGMYFLTGSQKINVMKGTKESLAGIVSVIEMSPLSESEINNQDELPFIPNEEFLKKKNTQPLDSRDVFYNIFRGFFPEVVANKNLNRERYYASYVVTYIEKDVKEIVDIKDTIKFKRFISTVAVRTGQELIISELAKDNDIRIETAEKWFNVLKQTGLVYTIQPFNNNLINRIIKRQKIYFADTGLAAYLSNIPTKEALETSYLAGSFYETYVVNEITKSFLNNGLNKDMYMYWIRSKQSLSLEVKDNYALKEIDLIIESNFKLYPIEIKKTSSLSFSMFKNFSLLKSLEDKIEYSLLICNGEKMIVNDKKVFFPVKLI
ncbi:MAG: AAA family ATPase [Mycoplasmataceae bacterium]|nr:AAA family ATPase [Mycoplasmataceae bacterium]